ncbi:MAG: hypothetical protein Unbinned2514contig1000_27 [Prokaryotic dsDNA virus sp.]|nr:MAG: hypothetical protein Unbinned2514contig1000_27 [Prokaryotic dsDNA virus sp.]
MPYRKHRPGYYGYGDYSSQPIGLARVMDDSPFSDGSTASHIENFHVDEKGFLVTEPMATPLFPPQWKEPDQASNSLGFSADLLGTIGMGFMMRDGEIPEVLFLSTDGAYQLTPWTRSLGYGYSSVKHYDKDGKVSACTSVGPRRYPAQVEVVANRMYFSYCDGGNTWVWDGFRIRKVGFSSKPSPPDAMGPEKGTLNTVGTENTGGWSYRGRVGSAESNWTEETDKNHTVGGVDVGTWRYAVVYEGVDGSYSAMSEPGGMVSMRKEVCVHDTASDPDVIETPDELLKIFRVFSIPKGPENCVARILLRTRNLQRLPPGDDGSFRFLHRIPNTNATEYLDNFPDGELGAEWQDREPFPYGAYFLKHFNGSMFYLRTDGYPARVWWSEQESFSGPIPESILYGHWMDVFPETGPITGAFSASLPGDAGPAMFVFKENAAHYLAGGYPNWQTGTLHPTAGCAGPSLIQADPDGSIIWYGSNTFWRFTKDGVEDIGIAIRKQLKRVNTTAAHLGLSWSDPKRRELVFWLPVDDATEPNQGFVWDHAAGGWRIITSYSKIKALLHIPKYDLKLMNAGRPSTIATKETEDAIWVYGRGWFEGYSNTSMAPAIYRTGWVSMSEFGPEMHAAKRGSWVVVSGEDSSSEKVTLQIFRNHNDEPYLDSVESSQNSLEFISAHPEDTISFMSESLYGTGVWRTPRFFSTQLSIDSPNARSLQVSLTTSSRTALFNIDIFGPVTSGKFSRVPGGNG